MSKCLRDFNRSSILVSIFIIFTGYNSQASIQKSQSALLIGSGSIRGGVASKGFGLMGVKSFPGKNGKVERLAFEIGSPILQSIQGSPGYFHIENDNKLNRVVINFEQTVTAKFDEKKLKQLLKSSPFVKDVDMMVDGSHQTTSIVLQLSRPASLRAVPSIGRGDKSAMINIDLIDESMLKGKKR